MRRAPLQYLYGLRLVGAVAVGLTEFSLLRFVLYQIVNCLIWAGLIGGVAYLLGGLVTEIFHGWFKWIWMVASAVLVVLLLRFVDRLLDRIQA
jgi:membrane protein DedA with SNARE-associated domain